jgi:hypothetical protein
LEVLFAIAIASIGILGVMGSLVVAGKQSSDAARTDGADRVGRNAIREFEVRGFNRATGPRGTWATVPAAGWSYCLDPLYVAANGSASPASLFPAIDQAVAPGPRMARVSVRAMPGNQSTAPLSPIGQQLAESIFVAKDDLVFSLPDDRTLPPAQHYGAAIESRSHAGAFSWFATIHRGSGYSHGTALLCIAVCHRRDLQNPNAEQLVNVEQIDSNHFKLAARSGQPDSDLDSREGGWLLLIGNTGGDIEFRWHQMQTVKDNVAAGVPDYDGTTSAVATRWVSTFGRDWPHVAANTQVALLDSVIAVYEKTIKMQE